MSSVNRNNTDKKESSVFTRETLGVVLVLFSTLCLICLITRDLIFSEPGMYVNYFLFGCFGYFAFLICLGGIIGGVMLVTDKRISLSNKKKWLYISITTISFFIIHIITMDASNGAQLSFGDYIARSYVMAEGGVATCSGGGVFSSILSYLFYYLLKPIGCYFVFGIFDCLFIYLLIAEYRKDSVKRERVARTDSSRFKTSFVKDNSVEKLPEGAIIGEAREYPVDGVSFSTSSNNGQKLFVNRSSDFEFKTKKDYKDESKNAGIKLENDGGLSIGRPNVSYTTAFGSDIQQKINYIKTPAKIDIESAINNSAYGNASYNLGSYNQNKENFEINSISDSQNYGTRVSEAIPIKPEPETTENKEIPFYEHDSSESTLDTASLRAERFSSYANTNEMPSSAFDKVEDENPPISEVFKSVEIIEDIDNEESGLTASDDFTEIRNDYVEETEESVSEPTPSVIKDRRVRAFLNEEKEDVNVESEKTESTPSFLGRGSSENTTRRGLNFAESRRNITQPFNAEEEKPEKEIPPINREYFRPPLDLLETYALPTELPEENHEERMEIIKRTLEEFHINAIPQNFVQGPSITRYEIMMPAGISVKKVLNLDEDLRMRLAARDGVRIQAPIPGKNLVGIEVANANKITVGMKEVLEGMAGAKCKPGSLMFAIGKDIVGKPIYDNLAKGPHYLVAGATGSGKSVCLNVLIVSLIMRYSPEELRLILIDPKRVEFRKYEHIPHLMIDEIITEPKKVIATLAWAHEEMERRYKVFEESGGMVVDIDSYNEFIASDTVPKMPRIVLVIDELADLMAVCKKDMESRIQALSQKARAAGVHLVLATQRPSVDIITGTIKANLPSRIALKVMNYNDSQTILGEQGAEKLLGNGDMLYKNSSMPSYERYQGAWISASEINNIVNYIKEKNKAYFDDELSNYLEKATNPKQEESVSDGEDGITDSLETNELFIKALELAINTGSVSISQLQRRFQIGYARAGGLVDKMETAGFISGNEGSKARKVLITREEFEERFGQTPDNY